MAIAKTLGVSRSNLHDRLNGGTKPRRRYHIVQDAALLPLIERLAAQRPTYGYRRITAVLNRVAHGPVALIRSPQARLPDHEDQ